MILALKTADASTSLWLFDPAHTAKPTAELNWESGRDLSEQLLGKITEFLHDHNADLQDLAGIIIFSGPGSFTSLRIGHTIANALADSLGIPVVGAQGAGWQQAASLKLGKSKKMQPALPFYGAEAHITRPKS